MELIGGMVFGIAVGWMGAWMLRQVALPASGLYPVSVLAISVMSYAGAAALHLSGFAAVYLTALWLGNAELPHRASTRSFAEGFAWLAQIGLFIMLGLLASPSTFGLEHSSAAWPSEPFSRSLPGRSAFSSAAPPLRLPWRGSFLAGAGLRGAVPIVLADPLAERVPRSGTCTTLSSCSSWPSRSSPHLHACPGVIPGRHGGARP